MIRRTITSTKIKFTVVFTDENGDLQGDKHELNLAGSINQEKATKYIQKLELVKGKTFLIDSLTETTAKYEISIEDFIKNATIIEDPKEEK